VCEDRVSSTDYSAKPSVSFTLDAITTVGNTVLNVGLIRSSGTPYAAKVTFSTSDMTATAGKDYVVAEDRTVVLPGGRTSGSVEVSILRGHGTFQIAISEVEVECEVGAGVFNCPGDVVFPSFVIANINHGNYGGPSLDVLFDPKLSSCRQEKSWGQITRSREWGTRYFTGGLGRLMMKDLYEVWICAKGDACSPAGDMMCYVFHEGLNKFEPLALNSQLHFV